VVARNARTEEHSKRSNVYGPQKCTSDERSTWHIGSTRGNGDALGAGIPPTGRWRWRFHRLADAEKSRDD